MAEPMSLGDQMLQRAQSDYEQERAKVPVPDLSDAYSKSLQHPDVQADIGGEAEGEGEEARTVELTDSDDYLPFLSDVEENYDLQEQAYRDSNSGTVRPPGTVSNEYLKPETKTVHGYDLVTGEQIMDRTSENPEAEKHYRSGVEKLRTATFNVGGGYDDQGLEGMIDIASGTIEDDLRFNDFERKINQVGVPPEQAMLAWEMGVLRYAQNDINEALEYELQDEEVYQETAVDRADIEVADLPSVPGWQQAASLVYEAEEGHPFDGEIDELVDWYVDQMSGFNWKIGVPGINTQGMSYYMARSMEESESYAQALIHMIDTYERVDWSLDIVGRNLKNIFTDPVNLVGVPGAGFLGMKAGGVVAKAAMKRYLIQRLAQGAAVGSAVGGVEGAVWGGATTGMRQQIEKEAGLRDELQVMPKMTEQGLDPGIAGSSLMGAGAGFVLGAGLGAGGAAVSPYVMSGMKRMRQNLKGPRGTGPLRSQIGAINPEAAAPLKMHQVPYEYVIDSGEEAVGKPSVLKAINPVNIDKQIDNLEKVAERNPDPLASEADWIEFERDLTGAREVPPIPYQMIRHANDEQLWAEDFSRLSKDQIEAAADGFNAVEGMKGIYTDGTATEQTTGKLFLWGMLSRMLSAHPHESAFLDAAVSDKLDEFVQRAVDDPWNQADVSEYLEWAGSVIPDYAPGKQGISNMNDFGKVFLAKLSQRMPDGRSKLSYLHDLISDHSIPSSQVRREFYGLGTGLGIQNKVLSFIMLMTGRTDVMVLDRIQINTLWDAASYGKLIYDDISTLFDGAHGLARYEALERSLQERVAKLYSDVGRPQDGSVGRYHWESWVLNSGQVVGHPTITGLERDARKMVSPYADLGAPEGRYHQYAYGSVYTRGVDGTPKILYTDSTGQIHRFDLKGFKDLLTEVKKPKNGVVPKGFSVKTYREKGYPWYEAKEVDRGKLDELIKGHAEAEVSGEEVLRGYEGTGEADVSREPPPAENAQRTQITGTTPSYVKANDYLDALGIEGETLDFGSGKGKGTEAIGSDDYEPFPADGYSPKYSDPSTIPDESYPRIINLNVLNVVPPNVRDEIVQDIARILEPNGVALIGTRGRDEVLRTRNKIDMSHIEPDAIETSRGTYQKGFTSQTLQAYVQDLLGDGFLVETVPDKLMGPKSNVQITKLESTKAG
jgi:SAM-dependent methyltransferase